MKIINRFFWWCAGTNIKVLEQCPTDQSKYFGVGGTIVFTALMALLAGGYAFNTAFHNPTLSVFFGIFWGLLIFNLDRYIVSTIGKGDGTQKITWDEWKLAAPRLLMAVLLGFVIATPLELRLFQDEIELEITANKNALLEERKSRLDTEFSQIHVIESAISETQKQIDTKRDDKDKYYDAYICERDGTCGTNKPGEGPEYLEKKRRYEAALKDLNSIESMNLAKIEQHNIKLKQLYEDKADREEEYKKAADNNMGLLARLDALGRRTSESNTLWAAKWLITLLFIFIEVAPVLFKLMSEAGPYDEMMERIKHEAFVRERQKISDINDEINTDIIVSTAKNKARLSAELKGNEELLTKIALAQAEIAAAAVEQWKEAELIKLEAGVNHIINAHEAKNQANNVPVLANQ